MKRINVKVVSNKVNDGIVYQRLHLPLSYLSREKYSITCEDTDSIRHTDLYYTDVLIMNHCFRMDEYYLFERARHHYNVKTVLDLDDLLTDVPSDHPAYEAFKNRPVAQILQSVNHTVFSTNYLKEKLGHLTKEATVIPNAINTRLYDRLGKVEKRYKNCFIVGWTGGQSHRSDQLYTFLNGLEKFMDLYPDTKAYFHVLCPDRLYRKYGQRIIFEPEVVNFMDYPQMSASYPFDVCLVGLQPNEFNESKSDLKLLEMGAHSIPIIASPRADFIQHKARDLMLYADTDEQWFDALEFAYKNQDVMKQLGEKSREYIMNERRAEHAAYAWDKMLEKLVTD